MKTKLHIINTWHSGDVILTRPMVSNLKNHFEVSLECRPRCAYLWTDLELPIFPGQASNTTHDSASRPADAIGVNLWFGMYRDLLHEHGMTIACQVHSFNRRMAELRQPIGITMRSDPMAIDFAPATDIPVPMNAILVENGPVLSGQSSFDLSGCIQRLAGDYPQLNFCCSSPPPVVAPNVHDFSHYNLIQLSHAGDKCLALVTVGSGVNAACYTQQGMYKPRCILGWTFKIPIWHNQVDFLNDYDQIRHFLDRVCEKHAGGVIGWAGSVGDIPPGSASTSSPGTGRFLRSRAEVDECSRLLDERGLIHHRLHCKDWDLAHIVPRLTDGNLLDMGSSDSYLLANAVARGTKGLKVGIDLQAPQQYFPGVAYMAGDLMQTNLPGGMFRDITCLSVIEHGVDFAKLASEIARLLMPGGTAYLTFDYWEPKVETRVKLYGLEWNILCRDEVLVLVSVFARHGLKLEGNIDWTLGERVIREDYCAPPGSGMEYTFGLLSFRK